MPTPFFDRGAATLERAVRGLTRRAGFLGPTLARLVVGVVFAQTGWGKLHNLEKVTSFFTALHLPLPAFQAGLVGATELFGGLALLLGLGTRLFAAPLAVTMVVAVLTAKRDEIDGLGALLGLEEVAYLTMFLWLLVAGPGPLSLDQLIARVTHRRVGASAVTAP
jgi:putative oxidoreductase